MLEAILWDNDGVLVDTEKLYFQACREELQAQGVEIDEADFAGVIGLATADFMDSRGIPKGMPKTTTVSSWRG